MLYVSFYLRILLGFFHYCGVSDPLGIIEMKKHPAGGGRVLGVEGVYIQGFTMRTVLVVPSAVAVRMYMP